VGRLLHISVLKVLLERGARKRKKPEKRSGKRVGCPHHLQKKERSTCVQPQRGGGVALSAKKRAKGNLTAKRVIHRGKKPHHRERGEKKKKDPPIVRGAANGKRRGGGGGVPTPLKNKILEKKQST